MTASPDADGGAGGRNSVSSVDRHARQVALRATAIALAVFVLIAAVADLAISDRLNGSMDARLRSTLMTLMRTHLTHVALTPATSSQALPSGDLDDFDDAPIFAWWVPTGSTQALALERGAPTLAATEQAAASGSVILAGRTFRLMSEPTTGGTYFVATSTQSLHNTEDTLLLAEAGLGMSVLLTFFVVATIIGRRAAAPVEQARRLQLDFTADASHELRTPLSIIEAEIGIALAHERDGAFYKDSLSRVRGESRRLSSIVDDLLFLARLDSLAEGTRATVTIDPVDLGAVAAQCADRMSALARNRGLVVTTDIGTRPALVAVPGEWLDRLTSVLLDNACRHAVENGRIVLTASAADGHATLVVDDDGPGIPAAERERVLARFHRAGRQSGAAGLGLAIADAIVRSSGGSWEIGSAPIEARAWPSPGRSSGCRRMLSGPTT